MKVITVASQKGGSGKTTLAGHLAVQAELAGAGPVVLIDADPQGSLADWWNERVSPVPAFAQTSVQRMADDLERLRCEGFAYAIIDTPPAIVTAIHAIVKQSDLVIIPTRPSPHDLRAAAATVRICEDTGKRFTFVVNAAHPRARLTSEAAIALSQHGTVAPTIIHNRTDFAASMIDGRTVMELNAKSKSTGEIIALWDYVQSRAENVIKKVVLGTSAMDGYEEVDDMDEDYGDDEDMVASVAPVAPVVPVVDTPIVLTAEDMMVEQKQTVSGKIGQSTDTISVRQSVNEDEERIKRAQMQASRAQEARMQSARAETDVVRKFRTPQSITKTSGNYLERRRIFGGEK